MSDVGMRQSNLEFFLNRKIGKVNFPVSTKSDKAQLLFNHGLAHLYGFDFTAASRAFGEATEIDPGLAMAYWGVALALLPQKTYIATDSPHFTAIEAILKAEKIRSENVRPISLREAALIQALLHRINSEQNVPDVEREARYTKSLWQLYLSNTNDLDAAVLFAQSLISLNNNRMWSPDGRPLSGTPQLISILESVLVRDSNHVGANHLYIHCVEASPQPWRGLDAAKRLSTLAPDAEHLVHMASHIYMRIGEYRWAVAANRNALGAYSRGLECGPITVSGNSTHLHVQQFLAAAACYAGERDVALRAAQSLYQSEIDAGDRWPLANTITGYRWLVGVCFREWEKIISWDISGDAAPVSSAYGHFAKAIAYCSKGRLDAAILEWKDFEGQRAKIGVESLSFNDTKRCLEIADLFLRAQIAILQGEGHNAQNLLEAATTIQDAAGPVEPPIWPWSVRSSLGALLFALGKYSEASKAFQYDLGKFPHNTKSLYGFELSLRKMGRVAEADIERQRFKQVWGDVDQEVQVIGR